ncbi:MAG TPA: hypothetical protein VFU02_21900 [Polyangiaceae bacterium]|nr:hypothetical protein [Polyangiaceae bacterium]
MRSQVNTTSESSDITLLAEPGRTLIRETHRRAQAIGAPQSWEDAIFAHIEATNQEPKPFV